MSAYTRTPENQVISITEKVQEPKQSPPEYDHLQKFPQFFYEIDSFCATVRQLEHSLKDEREKHRALHSHYVSENSKFNTAISEANRQIRDLTFQVERLRPLEPELDSTKKTLASERQQHLSQIQQLRTQIKQKQDRVEELNLEFSKSKDKYESELKDSNSKYLQICRQEDKLKSHLQGQISQSEKLKEQLQSLTGELQQAKLDEQKLVSKNQNHETKLSEMISEIQKYRQNLQHYQNELNQAKTQLTTMHLDFIQTRKDLNSSLDREKNLRENFDLLQAKTKDLVDELTQSHLNYHLMEEKLTTAKDEFGKTSVELERIKIENSTLEHNNQKWGLFLLQDFMDHKEREIGRIQEQLATIPESNPDRSRVVEILDLLMQQKTYLADILKDIER